MNICTACNEDFGSVDAFDEHRIGVHAYDFSEGLAMNPPVEDGRRCFGVDELEDFGWRKNTLGRWLPPPGWVRQAWKWDYAVGEGEGVTVVTDATAA